MSKTIITVIVSLIAYFIGSVNVSIMLSRKIGGQDIRESGSGNAGATNMLRTYGKGMAVLTLICDILKGVLSVLIAQLVRNYVHLEPTANISDSLWNALPFIAGLFAVLGHNFPIYFGFRGGKGVATSLGVVLMLDWKIGVMVLVIALIIMVFTRFVSLGSITAAVAFVVLEIARMFFNDKWNGISLIASALLGGLVIIRHHANIGRLIAGTENKLGAKKKDMVDNTIDDRKEQN